jgi:hypothetical protein
MPVVAYGELALMLGLVQFWMPMMIAVWTTGNNISWPSLTASVQWDQMISCNAQHWLMAPVAQSLLTPRSGSAQCCQDVRVMFNLAVFHNSPRL